VEIPPTPAQLAAGVVRQNEGAVTVAWLPQSLTTATMAERLEALRRNEPTKMITRRRLEREGLVMPDDVLRKYYPEHSFCFSIAVSFSCNSRSHKQPK